MQNITLKPKNDAFNSIVKAKNPEKEILRLYDKDRVWRDGYGYYGFHFNQNEKTIVITIGDSCD